MVGQLIKKKGGGMETKHFYSNLFNRIIFVSFLIMTISFSALVQAANYEAEVLSLNKNIDFRQNMGKNHLSWNGYTYKLVYSISEAPDMGIPDIPTFKIKWATIDLTGTQVLVPDSNGGIADSKTIIADSSFHAQNPRLFFTGLDYILLWVKAVPVETNPDNYYKELHASVLDVNGNVLSDMIVSEYIPTYSDADTYEYGDYTAVWGELDNTLYIVYAEGDPRFKAKQNEQTWSQPARLVLTKLYKYNQQLNFIPFYDNYQIVTHKIISGIHKVYHDIALLKLDNYLVLASNTNSSALPFSLTDLQGNIIAQKSSIFGGDDSLPTLFWDGNYIILGAVFKNNFGQYEYRIKQIQINEQDNGLDKLFTKKDILAAPISMSLDPILIRKDTGQICLLWKQEQNACNFLYLKGFDSVLTCILPAQSLIQLQNTAQHLGLCPLNKFILMSGTTNNYEYALAYTSSYNTLAGAMTENNLIRFNIKFNNEDIDLDNNDRRHQGSRRSYRRD